MKKDLTKESTTAKIPKKTAPTKKRTAKKDQALGGEPLMTSTAATTQTRSRRNVSSVIDRTDKFVNIDKGLVPFKTGKDGSAINVRDAISLCQKCYYNYSIFRNVVDLMTEFSVSDIFFRGGTAKSRKFFEALFKKINLWDFQDKFFREYYRSGNVFVYRFEAKIKDSDIGKISRVYSQAGLNVKDMVVPARYIILNPADVQFEGNLSFSFGRYSKRISDYELERLRNPKTDEDLEVFESLDKESKKKISSKPFGTSLYIPLDPEKTVAVFYKRQDYEPFAVPMGYPVLEDINFKAEMKKMDMAIARTMQQAILIVTMGAEPDKGGVNQKHLEAMQTLFANQSVGRVLIADYTTKAEFVIPDIASLLDPKKYDVVNRDINSGLNNILTGGGEKFANQQSKVEVFLARLKQARSSFLNNFLMPEIKRISKSLGMKNWPTPYFDEVSLSKNPVYSRVYTRLVELGILTPEEGLEAIKSDRLPDKNTSLDHQRELMEYKDEGLYEPIMQSGSKDGPKGEAGRPSGSSGIPQSTKNISPIGASEKNKVHYSLSTVQKILTKSQVLQDKVEVHLKSSHKVKKLNEKQKDIAENITEIIIANEEPKNWLRKIKKYCDNPVDTNSEKVNEINEISANHQLNTFLASVLYHSKKL